MKVHEARLEQLLSKVQQLGFHGLTMEYLVEPGSFSVWVGPSAAVGLEAAFEVVNQPFRGG